MSFVSWQFAVLCVVTLISYFFLGVISPKKQWLILLMASYVFYMYSSPKLVVFLLFSTITTWLFPLLIERKENELAGLLKKEKECEFTKETKKELERKYNLKKTALAFSCLVINIFVLGVLKYRNFFEELFNLNNSISVAVPLGISFYTFQSIGYCIDVYRGSVIAEKNLLKYALFVSYFPQICQGPIGKYSELSAQLFDSHGFKLNQLKTGVERMLIGYFKKVVVANNLGLFVDSIYGNPNEFSGIILAFATFLYAFQLYSDFSGYMDIVCGISECMGIQLRENFRTPYFSKSIAEFWRRWHISLGAWFKEYLFYPVLRTKMLMSLSKTLRKKNGKKLAQNVTVTIGLFITWFIIGFWHGSGYNFIIYGLFHGMFIILDTWLVDAWKNSKEKLHINDSSKWWQFFCVIRTFAIVCFGYVLFRANSLTQAADIYKKILTPNFYFGWSHGFLNVAFDGFFWLSMALSLLFCLFIEIVEEKSSFILWLNKRKLPVRWGLLYVMLLSVTCVLLFGNAQEASSGNFLYFKF